MKELKIILFILFISALGCNPINTSDCVSEFVFTEDCPCADNMYRWHDQCRDKKTWELVFRGGSLTHECMNDFLVILPKVDRLEEIYLIKQSGYFTVTHIIRRTDDWIYSEVLGLCSDTSNLPAFQVGINYKEVLDGSATIHGKVNWWHEEFQTYADTEEDITFVRYGE